MQMFQRHSYHKLFDRAAKRKNLDHINYSQFALQNLETARESMAGIARSYLQQVNLKMYPLCTQCKWMSPRMSCMCLGSRIGKLASYFLQ